MMQLANFAGGLAVAAAGAYSVAYVISKKIFKMDVTHGKLIGFLCMFLFGFIVIAGIIAWTAYRNVVLPHMGAAFMPK